MRGQAHQHEQGVVVEHTWEESKENFLPLKEGRKAVSLSKGSVLKPLNDKSLEDQRRKFVDAIKQYDGEDPLENWLKYIQWTREEFPAGGQKSELLPLLERCTREFHQDERYRNDIRYLRIWIQYADCLPDPGDVFAYLKDHGIGQGHALFYIAHATYCEMKGNYGAADDIYQKGIEINAVPIDRLQQKSNEFQHRMVRRIQRKAAEQTEKTGSSKERQGLRTLRAPAHGTAHKRKNLSTPAKGNGSEAISVFVDDEFSSQAPPGSASVRPSGCMPLPNFDQSRKENVQAAVPWVGQKIKQRNRMKESVRSTSTLSIPADPEFAMPDGPRTEGNNSGSQKNTSTLRQRLDKIVLEEQLTVDPLRLHKESDQAVEKDDEEPVHDKPGVKEQLPASRRADPHHLDDTKKMPPSGGSSLEADEEPVHESNENRVEPLEDRAKEPERPSSRQSPFEQDVQASQQQGDEDVTMATKEAYRAMNSMFAGSSFVGTEQQLAADPQWDLEPTMTINTRDALNAVNNMFKASFSMSEMTKEQEYERCCKNAAESSLNIREDTLFINDRTQEETSGLVIREDTIFLKGDELCGGDQASQGLCIREDTALLGESRHDRPESPGLSIREDTVFIAGDRALEHAPDQADTVQIGEQYVGSIADETVLINIPPALPALPNSDLNDENKAPNGADGARAFQREGQRRHGPLAALDAGSAEITGIALESDAEAEANLIHGSTAEDEKENFVVFGDEDMSKCIDPFDATFQRGMIDSLDPPVTSWPDVVMLSNEEAADAEKTIHVSARSTKKSVQLNGKRFSIIGKLGCGSYATVYEAVDDAGDAHFALKMEYPPCPWEWLLCKAFEGRLSGRGDAILQPLKMYLSDEYSLIAMPKGRYGTLQDLLNAHLKSGKSFDQAVVAHLSKRLFNIMSQLHGSKILHNDIKPDNIVIDIETGNSPQIGLKLIDIGRGVDIELLPIGTLLKGDSETDAFRCVEMRESKPWLWQCDAYSIACVIHCLIFGEYMEVERVIDDISGESYIRRRSKLPRTWDADLWEEVFYTLLNHRRFVSPPDWNSLACRMGSWLDQERHGKKLEQELRQLISILSSEK